MDEKKSENAETELEHFEEAAQYSDANEDLSNQTENHIAMNLSKTFEKENAIITAPTIFSTAPNRYNIFSVFFCSSFFFSLWCVVCQL